MSSSRSAAPAKRQLKTKANRTFNRNLNIEDRTDNVPKYKKGGKKKLSLYQIKTRGGA